MPTTAFLGILVGLLLWSGIPNSASWQWTFTGGSLWGMTLVLLAALGIGWGRPLGKGVDGILGLAWLGLGIPVVASVWPVQSGWCWWLLGLHGWAVYGVRVVARDPRQRLWLWRGLAVWAGLWSVISLGLWLTGWGQFLGQNAQPLGHPNYVAGYGVLLLPVVVALWWWERRWVWLLVGGGLAAVILTTQSRGGALGLGLMALGLGIQGWHYYHRRPPHWQERLGEKDAKPERHPDLAPHPGRSSRPYLGWALGGAGAALAVALSNPRWWVVGGGSPYRQVVWAAVGGMIRDHLWLGTGPGSSAWIYPRYRPDWAGEEAVAVWQLHTTLGQVTAEVGLLGIAILVVVGWGLWRWGRQQLWQGADRVWLTGLFYSVLGYSGLLVTDYQLDVAALSGLGVLLLGISLAIPMPVEPLGQGSRSWRRWGLGILILSLALQSPRYGAWWLSGRAYGEWSSLPPEERDAGILISSFRQAQQWFPWDPLYPLTLGWLTGDAAAWQQAQALAPYDEYLSSQLGWAALPGDPEQAVHQFQRSYALLPSRLGIASGLGFAKLAQAQAGIPYLVRDIIRHPHLIGSAWYGQYLRPDQQQALQAALVTTYRDLVPRFPHYPFLGIQAAAVAWWYGQATPTPSGSPFLDLLILGESQGRAPVKQRIPTLPASRATLLLMAWADPQQRQLWLDSLGDPGLAALTTATLAGDPDLRTWLQHPLWQQTYTASRGYLVLGTYRRADMPIVSDRFGIPVHRLFQDYWGDVFRVPAFAPDLDQALATLAPP